MGQWKWRPILCIIFYQEKSCSYAHGTVFANHHQLHHEAMVSPDTSDRIELQVSPFLAPWLPPVPSPSYPISQMQLSLVDGSVSWSCLFGSASLSISTGRMAADDIQICDTILRDKYDLWKWIRWAGELTIYTLRKSSLIRILISFWLSATWETLRRIQLGSEIYQNESWQESK